MKTIVSLVDFSDATFKVLKQAHTMATAFDATVIIMHIVPAQPVVMDFMVSPTVMEPPSELVVKADLSKLMELRESLTNHGVKAETRQFHGVGLDEILKECENLHADMIIVGSHGHGALYNLLIGSVTSDLLKKATVPVLVVPVVHEAQKPA